MSYGQGFASALRLTKKRRIETETDMSTSAEKKITRLVVCVDGTWMGPNGTNKKNCTKNNSNVFRVFASCPEVEYCDEETGNTIVQKHKYYHGLGQRKKGANGIRAGAFGEGCEDMIMDVYQYCCEMSHSPDDELWMYGFSRGAYIVRAVAALFDQMGALDTDMINLPSEKTTFKVEYAELLRLYQEKRSGKEEDGENYLFSNRCTRSPPKLKFIGLFDTVRYTVENEILSGIAPGLLWSLYKLASNQVDSEPDKGLHNLSLLSSFENVRHALALNEERVPFTPVRFAPTIIEEDGERRTFVEAWFLGTHLDIGGSARSDGLSIYPLQWMLHESACLGLRISYEPKRKVSEKWIENPVSLAFPMGTTWNGEPEEKSLWTFRFSNGVLCTMQDLREVHGRGITGSAQTSNLADHSIAINYPSFWGGNMASRNLRREVFNGISLRGHELQRPYGTIIHPSVYFVTETYKSLLGNDEILKDLSPWLGPFSNRLRCITSAQFPWTVPGLATQPPVSPLEGPMTLRTSVDSVAEVADTYLPQATYTYSSLIGRQSIRLLDLLPGARTDRLRCRIREVSLQDSNEYETLSWPWDASKPPTGLVIVTENGDYTLVVSSNLPSALVALRFPTISRSLWIDQVCINQADYYEKSWTVAWMPEIYRRAAAVCVWLQATAEDQSYEGAIELLSSDPSPQDLKNVSTEHAKQRYNKLVTILLKSPLNRRWVVPELANNLNVIIYCGQHQAPWSALSNATEMICAAHQHGLLTSSVFTPQNLELLDHISEFPGVAFIRAVTHLQHKFVDREAEAEALQAMIQDHPNYESNALLRENDDTTPAQPHLVDLVLSLSNLATSNPVDSIYALLPLSFEYRLNMFSEDYKQPLKTVYADFIRYAISTHHSLDIICQPWASIWPADSGRHEDLPSWIGLITRAPFPPDVCNQHTMARQNSDSLVGKHILGRGIKWRYSASENTKPVWSMPSTLVLNVEGFEIGSISSLSSPALNGQIPLGDWIAFLEVDTDDNSIYPSNHDLWKTLVGDRRTTGRIGAPEYLKNVFRDVLRNHAPDDGILDLKHALQSETEPFSRDYLRMAEGVVWNRRLVKVSDLHGLAPQGVKEGDLVVVLKGCSVPVVLRMSNTMASNEEEVISYTVVGECYLNGIMVGGKAIRGREDAKNFTLL